MEAQVVKFDLEVAKTFNINPEEMIKIVAEYKGLSLVPGDKKSYKVCRAALTTCVKTRTGINKRRLELNADDQKVIKGRNAAAEQLTAMIAPAEDHLSEIVKGEDNRLKAIEDEKAEVEKKKIQQRVADLAEIGVHMDFFECATMPHEEFGHYYALANDQFEKEQRRIAKEEKAKQAKEAAEKLEREKEDARLKAEAEKLAKQAAEQDEIARKLLEEQAKIDAANKAIQDAKDKEEIERKAKIQADIDAKAKIAQAVEEARIAAEELETAKVLQEAFEKSETERIERLKPDKDKLIYWAESLMESNYPFVPDHLKLESAEAQELLSVTLGHLEIILAEMIAKAKEL